MRRLAGAGHTSGICALASAGCCQLGSVRPRMLLSGPSHDAPDGGLTPPPPPPFSSVPALGDLTSPSTPMASAPLARRGAARARRGGAAPGACPSAQPPRAAGSKSPSTSSSSPTPECPASDA
eukprot:3205060-Rhodomonas_salina.1